jgi:hypothetical protein
MDTRTRPARLAIGDDRSERDLELDLQVGLRIEGFHWVAWNHAALAGAPVQEPGSFVGHPGDLLAHLYVEARADTPLATQPYRRLPRYSSEAAPALRAAERAGVFREEGAVLSCTSGGVWHVSVGRAGIDLKDDCLPRLLARAALRLATEDS